MSRPFKAGLDYFELDCHMDEKIRLIQAEFGLKGFAVVVLLFKEIYGGQGYYMSWDDDRLLLFMSDNGVAGGDKNLIEEVILACIKRGIFSEKLYQEYQILTSSGIQKRYLNAVARRGKVELKKEYLLVNVGKKEINVNNNPVNVDNNSINVRNNPQSREEKSREEKSNTTSKRKSTKELPPEDEEDALSKKDDRRIRYQEIADLYHQLCPSLPRCMVLTVKRKVGIRARLKVYSMEQISKALTKAEASDFMTGRSGGNWKADFEWFFVYGDNNIAKVLEGKYDNKGSNQPQGASAKYDPSIFERLEYENREDFA